jgi:hypothetical protein
LRAAAVQRRSVRRVQPAAHPGLRERIQLLDEPLVLAGNAVVERDHVSLAGSSAAVPADVTGDAVRRVMQPPRGLDPRQLTLADFSPDLHTSMSHSWSFGVQRRLGSSQVFEVRYAGNRGLGLFQSRNANPNAQNFIDAGFPQVVPPGVGPGTNAACPACTGHVNPNYATAAVLANSASSTYHGLQTRYEGRPLAQLTVGAAYTWSRAIDNASDNALGAIPLAQTPSTSRRVSAARASSTGRMS